MDMRARLITYLQEQLAKSGPEEAPKIVDEIHRAQRRVVKPRDASRDAEPIIVGVAR